MPSLPKTFGAKHYGIFNAAGILKSSAPCAARFPASLDLMGGYGSGDRQIPLTGTVEAHNSIDVREPHRAGALVVGTQSEMHAGEQFSLGMGAETDRVVFRYAVGREREEAWQTITETVPISWTRCNYGGQRPWFQCPRCAHRVAILYMTLPFARLRCRRCAHLSYSSQREVRMARLQRRANKLRARLIEGDGTNGRRSGWWFKPKGMHWRTFHQLCDEADAWDRFAGIVGCPVSLRRLVLDERSRQILAWDAIRRTQKQMRVRMRAR
jgi:hypothetical protein